MDQDAGAPSISSRALLAFKRVDNVLMNPVDMVASNPPSLSILTKSMLYLGQKKKKRRQKKMRKEKEKEKKKRKSAPTKTAHKTKSLSEKQHQQKKKSGAYKDKGLERPTFKTFPLCKTMSADPVT